MVSPSQYIALAKAAYNDPASLDAPKGWTKIAQSPVTEPFQGSANGYLGTAFVNDRTGEIVIANRGSRLTREGGSQDWGGSDLKIAAQGHRGVPEAFLDAAAFAVLIKTRYPHQPVSFTGHSLGGAEAQYQAAKFGGPATTFGAPGVRFAVLPDQADEASVVNYVLPGDLVGMTGTHVGQTVALAPSGWTVVKDGLAVGIALAASGPIGMLIAAIGFTCANHPIANYAAAIGEPPAAPSGGGKPAARLTDLHVCPMVTVLVPHVGGPIMAPCAPTVLIGGLPAARISDLLVCIGPPDAILLGSSNVLICGLPAARLGDTTVHGGIITSGLPSVLIGG